MQAVLSIMCVGTCIAVFSQRLTLGRFNANRWFWLLSEQEWFYERAFLMFMGARGPSLALKKGMPGRFFAPESDFQVDCFSESKLLRITCTSRTGDSMRSQSPQVIVRIL